MERLDQLRHWKNLLGRLFSSARQSRRWHCSDLRVIPEFLKQCLSIEEGILSAWLVIHPNGQLLGMATIRTESSQSESRLVSQIPQSDQMPLENYLPALATQLWSVFRLDGDSVPPSQSENASLGDLNAILLELSAAEMKLVLRKLECELPLHQTILLVIRGSLQSSFGTMKLRAEALCKALEKNHHDALSHRNVAS